VVATFLALHRPGDPVRRLVGEPLEDLGPGQSPAVSLEVHFEHGGLVKAIFAARGMVTWRSP
jgi:hypothetical protein